VTAIELYAKIGGAGLSVNVYEETTGTYLGNIFPSSTTLAWYSLSKSNSNGIRLVSAAGGGKRLGVLATASITIDCARLVYTVGGTNYVITSTLPVTTTLTKTEQSTFNLVHSHSVTVGLTAATRGSYKNVLDLAVTVQNSLVLVSAFFLAVTCSPTVAFATVTQSSFINTLSLAITASLSKVEQVAWIITNALAVMVVLDPLSAIKNTLVTCLLQVHASLETLAQAAFNIVVHVTATVHLVLDIPWVKKVVRDLLPYMIICGLVVLLGIGLYARRKH